MPPSLPSISEISTLLEILNTKTKTNILLLIVKMLRNAIKGLGTDEDALNRVIITRAEIDLKEIKDLYFDRNNISVEQAVAEDTSGEYRTFLLALLGGEGY